MHCSICLADTIETKKLFGSEIYRCQRCGLVWRSVLKSVYEDCESENLWGRKKDMRRYAEFVCALTGPEYLDAAELGAGSGSFYSAIRSKCGNYTIFDATNFGIDGATFQRCDLENINLGDEMFDVIFAFDLLEHIANVGQLFTDISRALKPGGLFIFETGAGELIWNGEMKWYLADETHKTFVTKKFIEFIASKNALDVEIYLLRRHKSTYENPFKNFLQLFLSQFPKEVIYTLSGGRIKETWNPFKRNHAFSILRK